MFGRLKSLFYLCTHKTITVMTQVENLISLFKKSGLTETEWIQLDNLDEARLAYDENEVVVENEHGSFFPVEDLSREEMEIFLFVIPENTIEVIDHAEYSDRSKLFYEHKGDVVCLHDDEKGQLGWFKVWYDAEMEDREYITLNEEIVYLDELDEL